MYSLGLPPVGILDVRRAAAAVNDDDLREHGVDCRTYFVGSALILRLEGEGDLFDKLRKTGSGGALLTSMNEHAWFDQMAKPLEFVRAAGTERGTRTPSGFTGVSAFSILPGHEEALLRELGEVAPTLERACPMEFWRGPDTLVAWFDLQEIAQVDQVLHEDLGGALQRVLHDHTGYTPIAWRQQFSLDQTAIRAGITSRSNFAPEFDDRAPKGTLGPMPLFRTPPHP